MDKKDINRVKPGQSMEAGFDIGIPAGPGKTLKFKVVLRLINDEGVGRVRVELFDAQNQLLRAGQPMSFTLEKTLLLVVPGIAGIKH